MSSAAKSSAGQAVKKIADQVSTVTASVAAGSALGALTPCSFICASIAGSSAKISTAAAAVETTSNVRTVARLDRVLWALYCSLLAQDLPFVRGAVMQLRSTGPHRVFDQ